MPISVLVSVSKEYQMYTKEEKEERDKLPLEEVTAENWLKAIQIVSARQCNALVIGKVITQAKQFQLETPK